MTTPQVLEPICLIVSAQHAPVAGLFPAFDTSTGQATDERSATAPALFGLSGATHTRCAESTPSPHTCERRRTERGRDADSGFCPLHTVVHGVHRSAPRGPVALAAGGIGA